MKQSNSLEKQSDNRLPTKQTQQEATLQQIVNLLNNMDQRLKRLEFKCDQNTSELKDIREESTEIKQILHDVSYKIIPSSSTTFVEDADMNASSATRSLEEEFKKSILNEVKLEPLLSSEYKRIIIRDYYRYIIINILFSIIIITCSLLFFFLSNN
jgi:type II secretory pathway component PulJ